MFQPGGPRQPEVDFDQLLAGVKGTIGSIAARLGGGGVGGVGSAEQAYAKIKAGASAVAMIPGATPSWITSPSVTSSVARMSITPVMQGPG